VVAKQESMAMKVRGESLNFLRKVVHAPLRSFVGCGGSHRLTKPTQNYCHLEHPG